MRRAVGAFAVTAGLLTLGASSAVPLPPVVAARGSTAPVLSRSGAGGPDPARLAALALSPSAVTVTGTGQARVRLTFTLAGGSRDPDLVEFAPAAPVPVGTPGLRLRPRRATGTPGAGTYTATGYVTATQAGTWRVARICDCAVPGAEGRLHLEPRDAGLGDVTLRVRGTGSPRVRLSTRPAPVPAGGGRVAYVALVTDAEGRPLGGVDVAFGGGDVDVCTADARRRVRTDRRGEAVRLLAPLQGTGRFAAVLRRPPADDDGVDRCYAHTGVRERFATSVGVTVPGRARPAGRSRRVVGRVRAVRLDDGSSAAHHAEVTLQVLRRGRWRTAATGWVAGRDGSFELSWAPTRGRSTYRVVVRDDAEPRLVGSASPSFVVVAI